MKEPLVRILQTLQENLYVIEDFGTEEQKNNQNKAITLMYQLLSDLNMLTVRMRVGQDSVTWYDENGNMTMHIDGSNTITFRS